jgi:dipeptidyl aminopeptidase/acylaminoacyl peptidase
MALNIPTKEITILAQDKTYDLDKVFFNPETYCPLFTRWHKERLAYQVLDASYNGDFEYIKNLTSGDLNYIQTDSDNKKWVLGFVYDTKSYEYYLYDRETRQATFLFYRNPEVNTYHLAHMEPISFTARDGLKIHGYLTCPPHTLKQQLPTVLLVHGGPDTRDIWGYDPIVQWLANRGYACVQINYRGSSGFGKKFLTAGHGEWAGKIHDDLIDGVQWLIQQGISDPKKIGIFGFSYGGYAALVGASFTPDVFCCAVDCMGMSNLKTFLSGMPPYWKKSRWGKYIGDIDNEQFLILNLPYTRLMR